jgi:hypothetical protein
VSVAVSRPVAEWLADLIEAATPRGRRGAPYPVLGEAAASYPGRESFEAWRRGRAWGRVRRAGLLII